MSLTHKNDQLLYKTILRMPKAASSFFYFALESNENMCFYSTLPFEKGQSYRDLEVFCTIELKENLIKLIGHYENTCELEVLEEGTFKDL